MFTFDDTVEYHGPRAKVASLTGSPLWGLSVDEVCQAFCRQGFTLRQELRPKTPYGQGPLVLSFQTPSGRNIIWIPSYGGVRGRDWELSRSQEKVFWILWQAGVQVLVVGGTSGTADWRNNEEAIHPGDVVLPWSFRTSPRHRGLPGTEFETSWPRNDLLLDDPFCHELSRHLARKLRSEFVPQFFRKLHTPDEVRVALVLPDGITFETTYDILYWTAISRLISESQPELPPVVTLHGDCVNPVLARLLGIHLVYYHLPSNWAQGLRPEEGIVETLYQLYVEAFPKAALELETWVLDQLPIPSGENCSCIRCKHVAPEVFSQSMTQP